MGWLFKESNLVLFSKRSAIKPQPLTILIRSPVTHASMSADGNSYVEETYAADKSPPVHPVGMAGLEPAKPLAPKASALPPELHSENVAES